MDRNFALETVKRIITDFDEKTFSNAEEEDKLDAIEKTHWALFFAPDKLKNDREFVSKAVKKNGWALNFAPNNLKNDKEVALEAAKQKKCAVQFASNELLEDKDFLMEVAKHDWNVILFSKDSSYDRQISDQATRTYHQHKIILTQEVQAKFFD